MAKACIDVIFSFLLFDILFCVFFGKEVIKCNKYIIHVSCCDSVCKFCVTLRCSHFHPFKDIFESHGKPPPIPPSTHDRSMSPIDEPVYDRVASDDEYKDYKEIDDVDSAVNEQKRKKPIDGKSSKEKRTEVSSS